MLSLPPSILIFLVREATDMRKQIDSLAGLVEHVLRLDPFSGRLFVFCNQTHNRLKILYSEECGYWLLDKRLESGTFEWPDSDSPVVHLTAIEPQAVLGGFDFRTARRRLRFQQDPREAKPPATATGRRVVGIGCLP